jgi:hypothetical protein
MRNILVDGQARELGRQQFLQLVEAVRHSGGLSLEYRLRNAPVTSDRFEFRLLLFWSQKKFSEFGRTTFCNLLATHKPTRKEGLLLSKKKLLQADATLN